MPARRLAAALAAILALAVLAGCASIPSEGPVRAGVPVDPAAPQPLAFRPAGPSAGASPEEILRGFIAAAVRPQNDYETARDYLTPDFDDEWNPDAGVLLHESPNIVLEGGPGALQLRIATIGQVSPTGVYEEYGTSFSTTLTFQLTQVDGQWRIAEAPDGVVLLQQTFERLYTQRTLYFFDPTFENLVPDQRWFVNGSTTTTRVVQALLAGPAPALAPPVTATAFPSGTTLAQDSVVQRGGQVVVSLDESVVRADALAQQRMKLQLTRSLVTGSVVSVALRAAGVDIDVPEFSGTGPVLQPQVDPRAAVGIDGAFGWYGAGEVTPIEGVSAEIEALAPTAVALDASEGRAVALNQEGAWYVSSGGSALVDERDGLIAPALDERGFLWSVPRDAPAALTVSDGAGETTPVSTASADLEQIAAIGVSRDGTRILVYGRTTDGPVLRVHGVLRDVTSGRPTGLSEDWFDMVPPMGAPVSATWVDETTVASLASGESGDSRVVLQGVGGRSEQLSRLPAAVAIVGANGENGLRALTAEGELRGLRGAGWQIVARGVQYVANQR